MYYMCIVTNQLAVTNTNCHRIFSVSLLGNKLYNYPNLSNCDASREESVDSGTSMAALR